jgi:uncharacterized membrane protein
MRIFKPIELGKVAKLTKQDLTDRLRSEIRFERTWIDAVADFLTSIFGTVGFLIGNIIFFAGWIYLNSPGSGFHVFDPFPYGLLTMAVSLEAIVLSIIVLITQNRQSKISEIRQKINFEVDVRAEEEITKVLKLQGLIIEHLGIERKRDPELARMEKKTDLGAIQRGIEQEKGNGPSLPKIF